MGSVVFKDNITKYQNEDKRLSSKYNQISIARITSFVMALIGVVYFADSRNGSAIFIVVLLFAISFVLLIKWHNRVKYTRNHVRFLKQINEAELARLEGNLSAFDEGEEFKSVEHPYSGDLDVFGRNSLFQLLNRTTTVTGREVLANWLCYPAKKEEIVKRQQAIEELKKQTDFCQNLEATGLHFQDKKVSFAPLKKWLSEPVQLHGSKLVIAASYILPIITIVLLVGLIWFNISIGFLLIALLANGLVLKKVLSYSLKIAEQTSKGVSTLGAISQLIVQVENTVFSSKLLNEIQHDLVKEGIRSSTQIKRLAKILDFFSARANMLYGIFDLLFLLDIHLIFWAEKWKIANRENVENWFNRISEFEVIASFARYSHANPVFTNPEILKEEYSLEVKKLGHPLIKSNERVSNNFVGRDKGSVIIITGSNMSGKSTFLRTLGVNMVLAYAGAPVCASSMQLSIFQVFTSMRTQDNLEEHISSFYAELKRIEQLLRLMDNSKLPVLYMLDEILKGTNSHDRHNGAMAIVKQLHKTNSFGFVSTHDLELGQQAETLDYCKNYSFNSTVENNKIHFDYTITEGICRSFNASILMKNIGIEIE